MNAEIMETIQEKDEIKQMKKRKESRIITSDICQRTVGRIIEFVLTVVVFILCVVVPLYAEDGYYQIGNAKFDAYRKIMMGGFGVLLVFSAVYGIFWLTSHGKKPLRLSLTDKFVLTYLILTGLSVVSGGFFEDALWGAYGWNMGFMSQLSFVLLYLFLSRFGRHYRAILLGLCFTAAVVYGIGILHRFMIDPIGFYDGLTFEQKAQFLSTLGQATWYAAFLMVTLPLGIGIFLYADHKKWRIAGGIYMALGFCTLVTQNSDSAYFALAGVLVVFFMISCEKREMLCRFLAVLTMFFAAGKVMYLLMKIHPNPALTADFITELMWTSGLTWVLLIVCLSLTLLLHRSAMRRMANTENIVNTEKVVNEENTANTADIGEKTIRRIRRAVVGVVVGLVIAVVLVIYMQSRGVLPAAISKKAASVSYLNWNDDWGNGRGRIWKFACRIISGESLRHRIFGIGPDCFNSYVTAYHGEEAALLWGQKQLTNAHNEWLNMLINGGILGVISYMGIYVTAIGRFLRGRKENFMLMGIAAACVSYMCYNFFCYQQVLCTPFVFILMGIGEYILTHRENSGADAV